MIKNTILYSKKVFKNWRRNNDLITSIMHLFKGSNSLQNTIMAFKRLISYDLLHICIAILRKVGSVHYSCTKINYADLLDCI